MAKPPRWARSLEPPEYPPGWTTGPPDFVGVGAQRAGTTWWFRGIEAHPGVVAIEGRPKELHYFNRFWDGRVPAGMAEEYASLFPRPPGKLAGEWTPRYMHDFWSPGLLRDVAPEARILIILRDPVERYRSGAARAVRLAERRAEPLRLVQLSDAVWRSFYFEAVRWIIELFGRERVLLLQFERCRDDPAAEMRRTCDFLGLEPFAELPEELASQGRRRPKPELPEAMRAELRRRLADDVRRLVELCPEIELELWPNFAPP